jgi:hypothetical protein
MLNNIDNAIDYYNKQLLTTEQLKRQRNSMLYDFLQEHVIYSTWFEEIYSQSWFWQWRYHKYDVLNHTRRVVKNFMTQYTKLNKQFSGKIKQYFSNEIDWLSKLLLTQLWLILHDAWKKPIYEIQWTMRWHAAYAVQFQLEAICKRFKLLQSHKTYLENIILHHDTPLEDNANSITREILKWNGVYIEWLLISLADIMSCEWDEVNPESLINRREFVIAEMKRLLVDE